MKYNANNAPLYCPQTAGRWYRYAGRMRPVGVLWHSTGANNPYIKRYVQPTDGAYDWRYMTSIIGRNINKNDWNHVQVQKGVNAFIGKLDDGSVSTVQCGPWDKMPWGCGRGRHGSCNDAWIQFEICEDGLTDRAYFEAVYNEACELTAYLCTMYNIDPLGTVRYKGYEIPCVLDHKTSATLGFGSDHADVRHWMQKYDMTMADARADIKKIMDGDIMTGEEISAKLSEYYGSKPTSDYAVEASRAAIKSGAFKDGNGDALVDDPAAPMTRQDLAVVLHRLGLLEGDDRR